jgi:galactokinase
VRLLATFQGVYPARQPEYIVQSPGREMWVAASVQEATDFTIHLPDHGGRTSFSWRSAKFKRTLLNRPLPRWAHYPAGVIFTLCAEGLDTAGINAVVVGEEPSGPRYDYGLGMAFATLWYALHDLPYTHDSLQEIVERVRRTYIEV